MSLLGKEWYSEFIAHKDGFKEGVEEGFKVGYETAKKEFGERKTGRWISDNPFVEKITFDESGCVSNSCHCSECKDWLTASDEYPCRGYYCPNCGAKMEVDE